jgi:hypothetical protein
MERQFDDSAVSLSDGRDSHSSLRRPSGGPSHAVLRKIGTTDSVPSVSLGSADMRIELELEESGYEFKHYFDLHVVPVSFC